MHFLLVSLLFIMLEWGTEALQRKTKPYGLEYGKHATWEWTTRVLKKARYGLCSHYKCDLNMNTNFLLDYELNIEYDLKAGGDQNQECEPLPCPNYGRATWDSARPITGLIQWQLPRRQLHDRTSATRKPRVVNVSDVWTFCEARTMD